MSLKDNLRHSMIKAIQISIERLPAEKRRKKAAEIIRKNYPLVLMYHSVIPHHSGENYTVSTATLEKNIVELLEDGYNFAFEDAYFDCPPQCVILTLDDGFANNYTEVFPLLQKYNVKASINLIANRISDPEGRYLTKEQIREMEASGLVQFQSHTCSHRSLNQLVLEEAQDEIKESKKKLQCLLNGTVNVLVYPREDFTEDIAKISSKYYDLCYGWGGVMKVDKRYTLPRIEILEGASDYAFQIMYEHRLFLYHKVIWSLRRSKPKNVYRKLLFSKDYLS